VGRVVKISLDNRKTIILVVVLAVSLAVRVLLFPLKGYFIDTNDFISWFGTAVSQGIRPFYLVAGFADYPPFNVYIFWFFGSIANATGIGIANIVKWVPNIFDLATAVLIYYFVRKQSSFKLAILTTALYAFNPAVIFNTAIWGQYDAVYTFFLVLSLMLALRNNPKFSAAVFALAILTKPQGIALAPLLIYLIFRKNGIKSLLISVAVFATTVFAVILPFEWSNPVTFLSKIYFGAYSGYQYTSINAFNLWGMFGLWQPDGNLFILGWALFGAFTVFTLYILHRRFNISGEWLAVFCAFMFFFAFFMLPTRIHERYMFPAISMLALMFPFIKKARPLYVVLTGTLLVNQAYVLYYLNLGGFIPSGDLVVLAVSVINLVMFIYGSVLLWDELKGRSLIKTEPPALSQTQQIGEPK
jgi:Gpi18-like mannosyltransferase